MGKCIITQSKNSQISYGSVSCIKRNIIIIVRMVIKVHAYYYVAYLEH